MGRILWPDKITNELKADLKHLRRKAIRLIDAWVLTEDSIRKLKWRIKKRERNR